MRKIWQSVIACLLLVLALPSSTVAEDLSVSEFRRLHALLQPDPAESWRTIPWQIELLDAQRMAARERKPIFIWAMDGHPLGCT